MKDKKKIKRVAVDCIYRAMYRSREFTTPGNFETFNLLKNKLDKMGTANQPGKLIFEFISDGEKMTEICICGHNRYAHANPEKLFSYRDACQVNSCGCRKYKLRKKSSKALILYDI